MENKIDKEDLMWLKEIYGEYIEVEKVNEDVYEVNVKGRTNVIEFLLGCLLLSGTLVLLKILFCE